MNGEQDEHKHTPEVVEVHFDNLLFIIECQECGHTTRWLFTTVEDAWQAWHAGEIMHNPLTVSKESDGMGAGEKEFDFDEVFARLENFIRDHNARIRNLGLGVRK